MVTSYCRHGLQEGATEFVVTLRSRIPALHERCRSHWIRFRLASVLTACAAIMSPNAHAAFTGLLVLDVTENNDGLAEFAIYAQFNNPTDHLHNVFSTDGNAITCTTGFFHNTIGGAMASALPYTAEQLAMSDNPDADSFVTIDFETGDNNNTSLDPNFSEDSFITGNSLGVNAGWFDLEGIVSDQGIAGPDGVVLIAVFTPLNDENGQPGIVSGTLTVGYGVGGKGPEFGTASFVTPAPGALALLGLAALRGSRRRRDDA